MLIWVLHTVAVVSAILGTTDVQAASGDVEEIYIARSVRETRVTPTSFCDGLLATKPSTPVVEDTYTFKAVQTRAADGRIVDASSQTVGKIHACYGTTDKPDLLTFSADVALGQAMLRGVGECHVGRADFPEKGITINRCFLDLSSLGGAYVGGELTTNTVLSQKLLGRQSDPPGYTQSSIATIRLWKRRVGP